jgi:Uma2 family endonuclease
MSAIDFLNHHRPLKLRVEDFLALNDSGAFEGYGKTELLQGELVYMNAQHRPHARVKASLSRAIEDALRRTGSHLTVLTEVTVSAPPHDAPEPDIVLTSEPDGDGPVPLASVALIVEVADATLRTDVGLKSKIYAAHGIAEYWVADVNAQSILQMWSPTADGYADQQWITFGSDISCNTVDGLIVSTETLAR